MKKGGSFFISGRAMHKLLTATLGLLLLAGCSVLPEATHQPVIHNPFPQLSRVAIAPFLNYSSEPTLDMHGVSLAYYNELQQTPGFEVLPIDVVEETLRQTNLKISNAQDARRLAQLLDVDAVVIGMVTDFDPYYPPRMGLRVEWYAANPCYHPIPPGYGLPWGTVEEKDIPGPLVFEAEMALAREQLKTQNPGFMPESPPAAPPPQRSMAPGAELPTDSSQSDQPEIRRVSLTQGAESTVPGDTTGVPITTDTTGQGEGLLPPDWPDPAGFVPPPPSPWPPACQPSDEPVLQHTALYNGHDPEVTEALATYYFFRDDARFGGWQGYLQRSDDFIRFCCHMHISQMLSARGGAGQTRVVWRWPSFR